jgi:cytochrome c oxidase subunit I
VTRPYPVRQPAKGSALARLVRTTDAKQIGLLYLTTSFGFFVIGGFMALLMRAELARQGLQFLSLKQYNQLFTMHGTIMLLLFATPILFAFARNHSANC